MSPAEFKEKGKEAAEKADEMVKAGTQYDLKDLLKDDLAELKMRELARAQAEATALFALEQLKDEGNGVTKESIEEARIDTLLNGLSMNLSSEC